MILFVLLYGQWNTAAMTEIFLHKKRSIKLVVFEELCITYTILPFCYRLVATTMLHCFRWYYPLLLFEVWKQISVWNVNYVHCLMVKSWYWWSTDEVILKKVILIYYINAEPKQVETLFSHRYSKKKQYRQKVTWLIVCQYGWWVNKSFTSSTEN